MHYLVIIEVVGQENGRDDERERAAFEAALQRGYPEKNRVGYNDIRVKRFQRYEADEDV